ncbi:MAG: hypothetical protein ABI778_02655 [Ignavibacteriota bacterium]
MSKISTDQAIEKAIGFVKGLKPEYLGAKPENIRLETIQLFGKEWVVVLSYTTSITRPENSTGNLLLEALSTRRYIKELEIDSSSGDVIAMRNPEAPVTTSESLAA